MQRRALVLVSLSFGLISACGSSSAPSEASPPPSPPPTTVAPPAPPPSPPPTTVAPAPEPATSGVGGVLGPDQRAWHTCTTDADCVLVRSPCGGSVAGNREHAAELQHMYDELARSAECATGSSVPTPVELACAGGECVARPILGGLGASGIGVGGS